jgi:16S rRNA (cytosine1402-N4)-methyltransferase
VLLREVLAAAHVQRGHRWVDGTFGRGGHSRALLEAGALVLGLDQDSAAVEAARVLETQWPGQFWWQQRNFRELKTCANEQGWEKVEGVLLDLGVSSPQLETAERGFSFQADGPLDMRMDQRSGPTAADLVNELPEAELTKLFYEQGGEREARKVARAIVARRSRAPFATTLDLAMVVGQALPAHRRARSVHPEAACFQALRIAVNGEAEALVSVLPQALEILQPGGVLAVISFHSGEDRTVKQFLRERAAEWLDTPAHPNTLPNPRHYLRDVRRFLPGEDEIEKNPRARSARLRVAIRNEEIITS